MKRLISGLKNNDNIKKYLETGEKILYKCKTKHNLTFHKKCSVVREVNALNKIQNGALLKSIITENREHYKMLHPAQKPFKMIEILVKLTTNKGDVVFDPFLGSGSSGIACINQGRSFIGCEIDEQYYNIAKNRINSKMQNLFYCME